MKFPESGQLIYAPASPEQWTEALALVFRDQAADQRAERIADAVAGASADGAHLADLLVAKRRDRVAAACWAQSLPGRVALIWGPQALDEEPPATFHSLLQHLLERLARQRVRLAQAIPTTAELADRLKEREFPHVVELLYLAAEVETADHPRSMEAEFVPYSISQRERLAAIIESTYEDTQDAPLLNGVRDTGDVIDGYMRTGEFDPNRWWLIRADGADAGCLLLADHPSRNHFELVYMGITPQFRGRGWGEGLVRFAQWQTFKAGRHHLILAVDAANDPAVSIYCRAGFEPVRRQTVCLRFL